MSICGKTAGLIIPRMMNQVGRHPNTPGINLHCYVYISSFYFPINTYMLFADDYIGLLCKF